MNISRAFTSVMVSRAFTSVMVALIVVSMWFGLRDGSVVRVVYFGFLLAGILLADVRSELIRLNGGKR